MAREMCTSIYILFSDGVVVFASELLPRLGWLANGLLKEEGQVPQLHYTEVIPEVQINSVFFDINILVIVWVEMGLFFRARDPHLFKFGYKFSPALWIVRIRHVILLEKAQSRVLHLCLASVDKFTLVYLCSDRLFLMREDL